jgi:beta-galactosidase
MMKIRTLSLVTLLCCAAAAVQAQFPLLDSTLFIRQINGIAVPYQNGIPVPSFEKQNRAMVPLSGLWKKYRFAANHTITMYNRTNSGLDLVTNEAGNRFAVNFDDSGWGYKMLPAVENTLNANEKTPEYYQSGVWYRRTFQVPDSLAGKKATLKFYSVNYVCDVWVNGTYLGYHEGGYTPFAFDVSSVVRTDTVNVIAVRVDNLPWGTRNDIVPFYTCDWFNYTGIIHDVYLDFSGPVSVVRADVVPKNVSGNVQAKIVIANRTSLQTDVDVSVAVYSAKTDSVSLTKEISAELMNAPVPLSGTVNYSLSISKDSVGVVPASFSIVNPSLWSPKHPNLYILKVTVSKNGTVLDEFATQFGIRTVRTNGSKFLLNEKQAFLHGIARHEDHPNYGRSLPLNVIFSDLALIKAMSANYIRTGHYPNHPYTYLVADRLGLMIMEEIPVWWFDDATSWNIQNNQRHIHHQMFREMVFRDYNRPSIAMWSTSNECKDVTGRAIFNKAVRSELNQLYPDGRLMTQSAAADRPGPADASQQESDVRGWTMYFGIFHGSTMFGGTKQFIADAVAVDPNKPVIDTEYGYWSSENGASQQQQVVTFDSTFAAFSLYTPVNQNGVVKTTGPLMGVTWWCAFDWYTHQQTLGYQSMGLLRMNRTNPKPVYANLTTMYKKFVNISEDITAAEDIGKHLTPHDFSLSQNFPNPFNPSTVIRYELPSAMFVSVTVSDLLGNRVATVVRGQQEAGSHTAAFNGTGLSSGVYFYTLRAGSFTETKRMVYIK